MTALPEPLAELDEIECALFDVINDAEPTLVEWVCIVGGTPLTLVGAVFMHIGVTGDAEPLRSVTPILLAVGVLMLTGGLGLLVPCARRTWGCSRTMARLMRTYRQRRLELPPSVGGPAARRWWWLRVWGPGSFVGFVLAVMLAIVKFSA